MNFKLFLQSCFGEAWELVMDWKRPSFLKKEEDLTPPNPYFVMLAIPVTGALAALALLLLWKICLWFLPGTGAAILFAVAAAIFIDCKDSGRGQSLIITLITAAMRNVNITQILPVMKSSSLNSLAGAVPAAVLVLLELFKLWGFYMLARMHATVWIFAVLVLGFAMQGTLMCMVNLNDGKPFLAVPHARQLHIWFVPLFVMLFLAIGLPAAALVAAAAVFVTVFLCRNWFEKIFGGVTSEMITLAGAVTEIMVLLLGMLFIG